MHHNFIPNKEIKNTFKNELEYNNVGHCFSPGTIEEMGSVHRHKYVDTPSSAEPYFNITAMLDVALDTSI